MDTESLSINKVSFLKYVVIFHIDITLYIIIATHKVDG